MENKKPTVIYENASTFNDKFSPIYNVYIDMTNWTTMDKSKQTKGIYPYVVDYIDANRKPGKIHSTDMKSSGINDMLKDAYDSHNLIVTDNTNIILICPREELLVNKNAVGCTHRIKVKDLRTKGMKAVPFTPTNEGDVDARLESVLDTLVHYSIVTRNDKTILRTKEGRFNNSIYHYEREDALHANLVAMQPEVFPAEFNVTL